MKKIREIRSLVIYWNMKQYNINDRNGSVAFKLEICKLRKKRRGVGKRKVPAI
jgi:hypothetical protein